MIITCSLMTSKFVIVPDRLQMPPMYQTPPRIPNVMLQLPIIKWTTSFISSPCFLSADRLQPRRS